VLLKGLVLDLGDVCEDEPYASEVSGTLYPEYLSSSSFWIESLLCLQRELAAWITQQRRLDSIVS
jgi:hypothetical protein